MFIEQPPWFFRALYPQAIFRMDPNERAVYLTFDDGPIPEVTPWVLELLKKHDIKATFFMVGDNIRKHPDEYRMVVEHGHRIGNHTFNHIRGFEYSTRPHGVPAILPPSPPLPYHHVGSRNPRLQ